MKIIYILLGFICMAVGAVGVVLPILPTTPFLLLASFFLAKGSKRFHKWFTGTKLYKNYLEDFVTHRAMTRKTKVGLLSFASTLLMIPLFIVEILWVKLLIIALIIFKYYYFIFKIRTIEGDKT